MKDRLVRVRNVTPDTTSSSFCEVALKQIEAAQELEWAFYMGSGMVEVSVPTDEPLRVVGISDTHIGSDSVRHKEVIALKDRILEQDNVAVVFLGDIIEGKNPNYLRTNAMSSLGLTHQMKLAREILIDPLASEGRVLGMVSGHFAHEGWTDQSLALSPWIEMVRDLDIPLIRNGGFIKLRFPNTHEKLLQVFHMTRRKSGLDPLHGITMVATEHSSDGPDTVWSAHTHQAAVGAEVNAIRKVDLVQSGTIKGTDPDLPDPLGVAAGMGRPGKSGQGVIFQARRRGHPEKRAYTTASSEHGEVAHRAITILDRAESQSMTGELIEKIRAEVESKPEVTFFSRRSRKTKDPHQETRDPKAIKPKSGYADQWRELSFGIQTELPIALSFIANTRLGSNSADFKSLKEVTEMIQSSPHKLALLLQNIIDKRTPGKPDRKKALDLATEEFEPIRPQTLGLMLDSNLQNGNWEKRVGLSFPIPAGTYLSQKLSDLPLVENQATVELSVGKSTGPVYTGTVLDHLGGRGASAKATAGLRSVYKNMLSRKPGFVAGGHMPLAGKATIYDGYNSETEWPHFVAPGWLAHRADWASRASAMPGGPGGLSIIFMPGEKQSDYLSFPTASLDETRYLHDALTLMVGLDALGLTDKVLPKG